MADMTVTEKTMILDGKRWQITQLLKTYINTGSTAKGLGNGHTTLEPGVLVQYKIDPSNYIHAQFKYWFPIGGDPLFEGQVFTSGLAWSHLAYDSDDIAVIYTVEGVHSVIENGRFTVNPAIPLSIDGDDIFNTHLGARLIWDTGGDLGVITYGLSWGSSIGPHQWYDQMLQFNIRFAF